MVARIRQKGKGIMTERELFVKEIPKIAEIITLSRKLTQEEFEQWKKECLQNSSSESLKFAEKIIVIIEKYR